MADKVFFFIVALMLALLVGMWGNTRKLGFGWAFGLSLLNLFIGIIAVACSKKKTADSNPQDITK